MSNETAGAVDPSPAGRPAAEPAGEPAGRPGRRPGRWRRVLLRIVVLALFNSGAGVAAAEAYVDSVPLPGDPSAPQASVLYYRDGRTILARVGTTDHSDVPLSAVPLDVRHAVLAAEDRDFYDHAGVSARGVVRAVVADVKGGNQGASTITQQYARNAYLTQDFSVGRKAKEFALAIKLERQHSKDEILQRYLNTIYFGRGAYGIAAAAHAYFDISPQQLTLAQGAVLAAVVKDPWRLDPANNADDALHRWKWIVQAVGAKGWIDDATAAATTYPALQPRSTQSGANGLVVDRVERELRTHGISSQDLHTKGLSVVTTLDPVAQDAALTLIGTTLKAQPDRLKAALVAVDPASGAVRAYYGGAQGRGYFDDAVAPRPAAATFKPITLAAGMREGIGYLSQWDGSSPRIFADRGGVPLQNYAGRQCPRCTLQEAMVRSLNTPFYALTEEIGPDKVRDMAVDLGISPTYEGRTSLVDVKGDPRPGRTRADISMGRYPVTTADLATVYATFAAGGVRHARYFVQSAATVQGTVLWTARPEATRVLDARIAADVSTVLRAVVDGLDAAPGRPAAGKSGTQQWGNTRDNQDAWMTGYTPQLATAIWMGRSVPGPIRDTRGRPVAGETLPSQLWQDFLRTALRGQAERPFPEPAHVGRTDVGDAGRSHGRRPDTVADPRPASGSRPVVHTAGTGRRLALTFDDGPSSYTPEVLDLLARHHVTAVFCVVGEEVALHPELIRRIVAEGHALCNHSRRHDDLGVLPAAKVREDVTATDAAIAAAAPGATVTYFRAPYGSWGLSSAIGAELGHTPLGWIVDPDDWMLPGTGTIVSRITAQLTPRAVVLVHDGGGERRQTVDALKILIPRLQQQGWTFDLPETSVRSRPLPLVPSAPATPATPSPSAAAQPSVSASPSPSESSSASPSPSVSPSGSPSPSVPVAPSVSLSPTGAPAGSPSTPAAGRP